MKKSVFSSAKLSKLNAIARGVKSSNDTRPAITTGRAINKFTMNASASQLMGCGHGDRVVMFALPDAESINEKFFIAVSVGSEGCKLASAGGTKGVGRPQAFNYASIWSQMIQQDVKAVPCGEAVLVEKGLMAEVPTQLGRDGQQCYATLANKRVEYGLELVVDETNEPLPIEVDDLVYERVYVLVDPKEIAVEDDVDAETEKNAETEDDVDAETERNAETEE